jgi:4-hydroxybenzoate polyprenyltransferase
VSALVTVVWAVSGAHQLFWPIWPITGIGIAVVVVGLRSYGPRVGYISDHDIDAEVARLRQRP